MQSRILLNCLYLLLAVSPMVADDRPNVLLLLVDDLKPSFGAYGESWVHSPNLDRLADQGALGHLYEISFGLCGNCGAEQG